LSPNRKIRPIRYKRPLPKNMVKESISLTKPIETGNIIEFIYGTKQKPGQTGGWKNDPKPALLVFYDDGVGYIEGINTNYLSDYYIRKVRMIRDIFPGISGEELYNVIKRSASYALKKGYRKYLRPSLKNTMIWKLKIED